MKIEIFDGEWSVDDVRKNPEKIFVFGDNNARVGKGGQAIIRGLSNTIGIRTKKGPSNKYAAFLRDDEYEINYRNILEDILKIKHLQVLGKTVVFAKGGYGTGLASLKEKSPRTYEFLVNSLRYFFEFDNETGTHWNSIPSFQEINFAKYINVTKDNEDMVTPINNSFFKSDLLGSGLTRQFDLVKSQKKLCFTSTEKFEVGQILNLNFHEDKYLVVRVCDSYSLNMVNDEQWSDFEGFSLDFINNNIDLRNRDLYQTFFQFICTLDVNGNMIFRDNLFSEVDKVDLKSKIIGDPIRKDLKQEEDIEDKQSSLIDSTLYELLKSHNIPGEVSKMPDFSTKGLFSKRERYQVKSGDTYYAIDFKQGIFKNTIEIILTSKNPFI